MSNARNLARLLPNTSGLLPDANLAGLSASKLSGALARANMASGTVLQAVQATNASTYSISGNGTFTNLSVTITPTAANSKFLLIANIGQISQSGGGSTIALAITRNGTSLNYIAGGSYNGLVAFVNADNNAGLSTGPTISFIDSPATASPITYAVKYECDGTKYVGRRADTFIAASQQFQVLEIAG